MPSTRPSYKDNEFLVAVRHNEFRDSPPPTPEQIQNYKSVALSKANRFWYYQQNLCKQLGYDFEDVYQYSLCWLTSFCAKFERKDLPVDDNRKLFHAYLAQRFEWLGIVLKRKNRSVTPRPEYQLDTDQPVELDIRTELQALPKAKARKKLREISRSMVYGKQVRDLAKSLLTSFA